MGVQLLDKTRKINKLLHNNSSSKVVFNVYLRSPYRNFKFERISDQ